MLKVLDQFAKICLAGAWYSDFFRYRTLKKISGEQFESGVNLLLSHFRNMLPHMHVANSPLGLSYDMGMPCYTLAHL